MHIFIDESGAFIPLASNKARAAAVVAVAVPSQQRTAFGRAFQRAKREIGLRGREVKGSALSARECARLLGVLRQYNAIAQAVVIDVGHHSEAEVDAYKTAQAAKITEHITRDHQATLIHELLDLGSRLERLSNQLFLQAFCLWQLIPSFFETATMYFSQRMSRELGNFVWRIDAKDPQGLTNYEQVWSTLVGPLINARTARYPIGMIPGADYSHLGRFDTAPLDGTDSQPGHFYTDMKAVLREDLRFVRSESDLGVQAADLVASSLTRALNGTLDQSAWADLGSVFITEPSTVNFISPWLGDEETGSQAVEDARWIEVWRSIEQSARPMLTPETARRFLVDGR